ncbi:hypothetical protein [Winogradskyella alexanderae]|uniref:Carboxypeptidase-like protein n=1 Tax=Winogradskyella alexanderae TaxID=2877123 RepID=A0ABS7XUL3_9FLAO|nr:hypothetical protein [Winogradskyella alexanderae]MCA0133118.1 hypothetical protein [Winogradskyella alexanderae]
MMHRFFFTSLLLFTYQFTNAQILKAKVYDATTTVKGIKVYNKTQNRLTATDEEGNFALRAKIGDSIFFESLFHQPKTIAIAEHHFGETTVFELKKIVTTLQEVEILAEAEQPVFEKESYNSELQELILSDIKNNPHLYMPEEAYNGGANILGILNLVVKLFKKKNKFKAPVYKPLKYHQIDSLFANSSLFNENLLMQNLKIPPSKLKMFFEFCAAKGISSKLLKESKQMELLDIFVENSSLFLEILDAYKKSINRKN